MNGCTVALLAALGLGAVSCGGDADPVGPTSMADTGGSTGSGGSCNRPAAPANLVAAVSLNNVAFTWSLVAGAQDYQIVVGTTPSTSNALSTNTTQTSYNWNGVAGGTYYARVEARNSCGSGAASSQVTFTVHP